MGSREAAETEAAAGGGGAAAVDEDAMADAVAAEAGAANGPGSADGDGNATRGQVTPPRKGTSKGALVPSVEGNSTAASRTSRCSLGYCWTAKKKK